MAAKTNAADEPKEAPASTVSRTEAITQALAALGKDAKPTQITGFIKDKFGMEMSNSTISAYKSTIIQKAAKTKPVVAKAADMQSVAKRPSPAKRKVVKKAAPKPAASGNGKATGIILDDIMVVKNLVGTVGANSLKTLIDVLSK